MLDGDLALPPPGAQPRTAGLTGSQVRWSQAQWHSGDMEQFSPMKGKINDNSKNSPLGLANTQVPKTGRPILIMEHTHICKPNNQQSTVPVCKLLSFHLRRDS